MTAVELYEAAPGFLACRTSEPGRAVRLELIPEREPDCEPDAQETVPRSAGEAEA